MDSPIRYALALAYRHVRHRGEWWAYGPGITTEPLPRVRGPRLRTRLRQAPHVFREALRAAREA